MIEIKISMPTSFEALVEIDTWCVMHCKSYVYTNPHIGPDDDGGLTVVFRINPSTVSDITLFKLTWG